MPPTNSAAKRGGGYVESPRQVRDAADFFRGSVAEFEDVELAGKVHRRTWEIF